MLTFTRERGGEFTWSWLRKTYAAGKHGLLEKAMYGTRDAAQNWEMERTEMMAEAGLKQGSHSAPAFYHKEKNWRVAAHGHGFTLLGPSEVAREWMEVKFKSRLDRCNL